MIYSIHVPISINTHIQTHTGILKLYMCFYIETYAFKFVNLSAKTETKGLWRTLSEKYIQFNFQTSKKKENVMPYVKAVML